MVAPFATGRPGAFLGFFAILKAFCESGKMLERLFDWEPGTMKRRKSFALTTTDKTTR